MSLVELLVLPYEQDPQAQRKESCKEGECGTEPHALGVPRTFGLWEDVGAQKRSTLANKV